MPVAASRAHCSESRSRVLNAAYTLFVQSGYTDVSMQQIADEAAITKATLYHHFRDKQDLYIETMRFGIDRTSAYFSEALRDATDLNDVAIAIARYYTGSHKTDMQRLASDFRRHIDKDTQRQAWSELQQPWVGLHPALEAAIARGEVMDTDVDLLARYFFGAISGIAMVQRVRHPDEDLNEDELRTMVDYVVRGLRPVPEGSPLS